MATFATTNFEKQAERLLEDLGILPCHLRYGNVEMVATALRKAAKTSRADATKYCGLTCLELVRLGRIVLDYTQDTGGCLLCCVGSDYVHDPDCTLGRMLKRRNSNDRTIN